MKLKFSLVLLVAGLLACYASGCNEPVSHGKTASIDQNGTYVAPQ